MKARAGASTLHDESDGWPAARDRCVAGEGHTEVARRLVAGGAEVQVRTTAGYTALHFAAGAWHTQLTGRLQQLSTI